MRIAPQPIDDKVRWQKVLYRKIGDSKTSGMPQLSQARVIERIISMAKVMHGLHMVGQVSEKVCVCVYVVCVCECVCEWCVCASTCVSMHLFICVYLY